MEVIMIETEAFYALIDEIVSRIEPKEPDKWILEDEAMKMLGIKSKTHLWKLRTEGKIRFSQPSRKVILYDRTSILDHLEEHAKSTF